MSSRSDRQRAGIGRRPRRRRRRKLTAREILASARRHPDRATALAITVMALVAIAITLAMIDASHMDPDALRGFK